MHKNRRLFSRALFGALQAVCISVPLLTVRPADAGDAADRGPAAGDVGPGEAERSSSGVLTITTYGTGNEGHLITFPDSSTLSIDCAEGDIITKSHFHADHCAECDEGQYHRNNVFPGQIIYSKDGVAVQCVAANGKVIGEEAVHVGCDETSDENKESMALLISYGGFDYLTAGDLTSSREKHLGDALVARDVHVDVVKVSHHGSGSSSSAEYFLDILPEYAVICGSASAPTEETLENLETAGVQTIYYARDYPLGDGYPVYRANGDIVISTDGTTYSFSGGNPHFSHGPYQVDEDGPVPTPLPTPSPTPGPHKRAEIETNASVLRARETLRVSVAIQQILLPPFDAYAVILGPPGPYSIQFGNSLVPGVHPIVRGVLFLPAGYYGTLLEMAVPPVPPGDYRVIVGFTEVGRKVKGVGSAFLWDEARFSMR